MGTLEDFIKEQIEKIRQRDIDSSVVEFRDTQTKYIVPKSTIMIEIALKDGLIAKIDVTKYFKEIL